MGVFPVCETSEMIEKLLGTVCGKMKEEPTIEVKKVKGTIVLKKKNMLDVTDVWASILDRFHELFGKCVSFQLISALNSQPG